MQSHFLKRPIRDVLRHVEAKLATRNIYGDIFGPNLNNRGFLTNPEENMEINSMFSCARTELKRGFMRKHSKARKADWVPTDLPRLKVNLTIENKQRVG